MPNGGILVYHNRVNGCRRNGYIFDRIMLTNVTKDTRCRVGSGPVDAYLGVKVYIKIWK